MTDEEMAEKYAKEKINDMKVGNFKLMEISHLSNGADIYNPKVEHLLKDKIKQAYLDGLMTDTQETNEFDEVKYLENLLKISQETQEELSKRILEQQKTIGSLKDTIDELKAQVEKMKCCGNCGFAIHNRLDGTFCDREAEYRQANEKCNKWELAE